MFLNSSFQVNIGTPKNMNTKNTIKNRKSPAPLGRDGSFVNILPAVR